MWISETAGVTVVAGKCIRKRQTALNEHPARRTWSRTTPVGADARPGWRLLERVIEIAPLLAILSIAALVGSLVWLAERNEREELRQTLIRDALWVEQALRFQIGGAREAVEQLALDLAGMHEGETAVANRMRAVMTSQPEIARMEWRDGSGRTQIALPSGGEAGGAATTPPRLASASIGPPYRAGPGGFAVDITVPILKLGSSEGLIVASIGLDRLVANHVPWWITQNNLVQLTDRDGLELASKSSMTPDAAAPRYSIDFDPPIPGALLSITANGLRPNITLDALVAAIFGLAIVAALSIFALNRHYKRRLEAETSLGEAEALRRSMEHSLTVGMRARDLDGRIIYVNPAFCRMVGHRAEDLIGHSPPMPYWLPDLVEETLARHDALARGDHEPSSFETRFRRPDGTVFDVLVYEAPLVDADGVHRGWMGSIIDVTDRKKAEALDRLQAETLARTGRLITMGEMASTIAHELNQPLAAIASYGAGCLNLLRGGRYDPADVAEALEKLDAQAQRAGQIIRRVHDFVRKREPRFGRVDVAALLQELAGFLGPDARKQGVRIEVATEPGLPTVEGDRILLEQVVLNLMRNAVEAMAATSSGRKTLTIGARLDPALAERPAEVAIFVADRGPGIDPDVADRLFSPFVTTKAEGMGMGLNICRSIMELHQGRLAHAAREGGGTIFTAVLPARGA